MARMTWEERMSAKHRPAYPTDPVPPGKPTLRQRWYWQTLFPFTRFRWLKYPRPMCRTCFEWKGEWKTADRVHWEPQYMYWMVCSPFGWRTGKTCPHRHHNGDVALAVA